MRDSLSMLASAAAAAGTSLRLSLWFAKRSRRGYFAVFIT